VVTVVQPTGKARGAAGELVRPAYRAFVSQAGTVIEQYFFCGRYQCASQELASGTVNYLKRKETFVTRRTMNYFRPPADLQKQETQTRIWSAVLVGSNLNLAMLHRGKVVLADSNTLG
jgi:hypothetical protein